MQPANLAWMQDKPPPQKLRGRATILPPWWLEDLQVRWDALHKETRWGMQRLADYLTDLVDRKLEGKRFPWDRKTVERFLAGESPTEELVEAFCKLFPGLVPPTYVAGSREEAEELRKISTKYAKKIPQGSGLSQAARKAEIVNARAQVEQMAADQTRALDSRDDARKAGAKDRRRTRGVVRGRSASS